MAIDDDPLKVLAQQIEEDSKGDVLNIGQAIASTVANVFMPKHIGELITGVVGAVSQARWNERVASLLKDFAARVSFLSDAIPDPSYYGSEEFQALLIEAIDQERTNRFHKKREMLASGLARSGTSSHVQDQSKELYFKLLRDLDPFDINLLEQFANASPWNAVGPAFSRIPNDQLLVAPSERDRCRRLVGLGIMSSRLHLERTPPKVPHLNYQEMSEALSSLIEARTSESYHLSPLGRKFIGFLQEDLKPEENP